MRPFIRLICVYMRAHVYTRTGKMLWNVNEISHKPKIVFHSWEKDLILVNEIQKIR